MSDERPVPEASNLAARKRELVARLLREQGLSAAGGTIPRRTGQNAPLSFAQQRLWFLERLAPGRPVYNVTGAVRLQGSLDRAVLERSLSEIVRRHEALRTTIVEHGGEPEQCIAPAVPVTLSLTDLEPMAPGERQDELVRLTRAEAQRPFDFAGGSLLRLGLVRLSSQDHALLLALHHAVADGWSMGILIRELAALYPAMKQGSPSPLPEPLIQYGDFAAWQRERLTGERLESELGYWRAQLGGAPSAAELPLDHPRPSVQTFRGARVSRALSPRLGEAARSLGQQESATVFMVLLATFQALVHRYTGQRRVVVGSPIAGRNRSEIEGLIGFFVNTLALHADVSGEMSFREILGQTRRVVVGAHGHQDLPFERLVEELAPERDLSRSPLFQIAFSYQQPQMPVIELPEEELVLTPVGIEGEVAKFDLTLYVTETPDALVATVEYNVDLFEKATIERLLEHYRKLLTEALGEPDRRLDQLAMLGDAERRRLLVEWNATGTERPPRRSVHRLFEEQVARAPGALAVSSPGRRWSYGDLEHRANSVARDLRGRGIGRESRVGVCLERGPELVAAILGVLKAGGAYVALDPESPGERLRWMVTDSGAPVVLTQSGLLEKLEGLETTQICLDRQGEGVGKHEGPWVSAEADGESLAYVIYTSGSSGVPKGVELTHRGLENLVEWHSRRYGVEETDRATQLAGLGFDASVWEVWPYLTRGASLHLPEEQTRVTPRRLCEWLCQEAITLSFLPTPLAEAVLGEGLGRGCRLRALLTGGDRLRRRPTGDLGFELVNHYGPTENTVVATAGVVRASAEEEQRRPSIGKPISNVRAYVLDGALEPVPTGIWGELYLGGAGLARGYVGRSDLTAERFVPDPHGLEPGGRLYRTGDVVRHLPNGELDFRGRSDAQVKVRGHRIELGEIEAVLVRDPSVREAVVVARGGDSGDTRLVAYVVRDGGSSSSISDLRLHLRGQLPDAMVPAFFVELDALPLAASGKVDRRALPEPEPAAREEPTGPRDAVEEILAGIFGEALGLDAVGIHDGFFDLGGHSLLATRVMSRAREALGVELPLSQIFETPTVAGLAQRLSAVAEDETGGSPPPLTRVARDSPPPLSFAQQRLWLLQELEPTSSLYNVATSIRLRGPLDAAALEASLASLVQRHESLRTRFGRVEGHPVQLIDEDGKWHLVSEDLSSLPEAELEIEVRHRSGEEAQRPFDLSRGPLFRARLLRLGEQEHVLVLAMHHAVSDGWSVGILVRELGALYAAFLEGQPSPLPDLPVQYADFASWQREWLQGEVLEKQLAYWRKRLQGAPQVLELPTDRPRPAVQRHRGASRELVLPVELTSALQQLSRREGATLYMVLLAAFEALLCRYSGQTDIVVGSPIANRTRREVEGLIGFFVNTLVLRTDVSRDPTFRELVGRVKQVALGAYAHQDLPFEKLVEELRPERALSHHPLFQVMFTVHSASSQALELSGLSLTPQKTSGEATAKFDLLMSLTETREGLRGSLGYDADLFDDSAIERMVGQYQSFLEKAVSEPGSRLSQLFLLGEEERYQVLEGWNETSSEYPEQSIGAVFGRVAKARPEAEAVSFGDERLSYGELETRSNQLARHLRKCGVGVETRVGICMERSLELVVGLLGILKAGGVYVPLDPEYPPARLDFMVQDAGVSLLLTSDSLADRFEGTVSRVIRLDRDLAGVCEEESSPVSIETGPEHLAYVTYTSGSTGVPKGVEIRHRGVLRLVFGVEYAELGPEEVFLQLAPVSFDASTLELWAPLLHGGRCVLFPGRVPTPRELGEVLSREGVTTLWLTASLYNALVDEAAESLAGVKQLLIGGEALSVTHVKKGYERLEGTQIINGYGPTEGTTFTCCYRIPRQLGDVRTIPIGRPIGNTRVYVLGEGMEPVPVGIAGELHIGGDGLGRGYLNRPALTAERFVPDPFAEHPGGRLYRTGDLARWLEDGRMEYLGRLDAQVKVRGYRIELGEIESVLQGHAGVAQCSVVVREDTPGDKRLVGYFVPEDGGAGAVPGLREHLRSKLPEYMVPGAIVELRELPLTPNGKVDHRALPAPEGGAEAAYVEPKGEVERAVAGVWRDLLGVDKVSLDDNFFDLGGHSLLLVQMHGRLGALFPASGLQVVELFEHPTVRSQSVRLARSASAAPAVEAVSSPGKRGEARERLARRRAVRRPPHATDEGHV